MSDTPRLRSAFPATPRSNPYPRPYPRQPPNGRVSLASPPSSQPRPSPATKPVQKLQPAKSSNEGPLVPYDVVDAPTQRFYVAAFYVGLFAWRIYNAWNVTDDLDSTWLFLKWIGLDAAFFVAMPTFRIPWLQWSFGTTLSVWTLHVIFNAFLMYKIPIPIFGWGGALLKLAYDRELAISEHRVKPANILHNSSVILGKQIIQILPEGSAILNPEKLAFCLDATRTAVELPIQINQTTPISIELVRYNIDSDESETIAISARQARSLKKIADKAHPKSDTNTPRTLHYAVSKTGVYRLARVVDESKLDVRKRSYDVAVVACPKASVSADATDKCTGDLSGVSLHVEGVPPFKVVYSKRINHQQFSSITQSVQPSESEQILHTDDPSSALVNPNQPQKSWTRSVNVSVEINESLHQNGTWSYHIEEVHDGLGNRAMFDTDKVKTAIAEEHARSLTVHRRPVVYLASCDSQNPLRVAAGNTVALPVQIKPQGQMPAQDWPLELMYRFTPENEAGSGPSKERGHSMADSSAAPLISKPGKYSLESIRSRFCQGEVKEPSSCSLYNPPRPGVTLEHENLFDKCAGNPIGMLVNLDFTGTPPFTVRYTVTHRDINHVKRQQFNGMRGQLEFLEQSAGAYAYQILAVDDAIYGSVDLKEQDLTLRQNIKPPASASFQGRSDVVKACLGQPFTFPVQLQGEGPWNLDYELVHGGKRKKHSIHSESETTDINISELKDGGKYTIVLTGVQDRSRCRTALTQERHIEVRAERPSAAFGDIAGRRTVNTLEGKQVKIPLRLQGVAPWSIRVQNIDRGTPPRAHVLHDRNAVITEQESGTYELVSVHDSCPGVVDPKANKFSITWIERPTLNIKDQSTELVGTRTYQKAPVCQGYEDNLGLVLTGSAPYHLQYSQKSEPLTEKPGISSKSVDVASNGATIKMETSKAGQYTYIFKELADNRYNHNKRHFSDIQVRQQVYALPTAKFVNSGKVYGYCKDDSSVGSESDSEMVPIALTGSAPFTIEIAITHTGSTQRPEVKRIIDITDNSFLWPVSRSAFDLGTHTLQIRSVKDSHGCESMPDASPSIVRVHVSAPPTISALESTLDYCIGDRVGFALSGQAPFDVFYTFQGRERKARVTSQEFRRIAEQPGEMIITGISDSAMSNGKCRARKEIRKNIHPYPSVRIEQGDTKVDDIHEGGEVDIHFTFTGTPPFEFTYTRSENLYRASNKLRRSTSSTPKILETRHDTSDTFAKTIRATEEGTYEVVAIKDRYCSYSAITGAGRGNGGGIGSEKLIKGS